MFSQYGTRIEDTDNVYLSVYIQNRDICFDANCEHENVPYDIQPDTYYPDTNNSLLFNNILYKQP